MKKRMWILLAALLVCLMIQPVFAAGSTMTVTASKDTAAPGDTLTVTVSINETLNCTSLGMGVQVDSAAMEVVEGSFKLLVQNVTQSSFKYNANAGGYVAMIQMAGAQTVSGDLFQFSVKIKDSAPLKKDYTITGAPSLRTTAGVVECAVKSDAVHVACNHSFGSWSKQDNDYHARTCSKCKEVETKKHNWEGEVTKENGCDQAGEMTYTCKTCGAVKKETIKPSDHVWNSGKVTKEATCAETGTRTYTCASCKTTKTETIAKTDDHDFGEWKKVDGSSHSRECSICHKTESVSHNWDNGRITKPATCAEVGEKTSNCVDCGATKVETVAKSSSHKYDNGCDDTCNYCGETRTPQHKYQDAWSSDSSGHWHVCSVCGDKRDSGRHTPGTAATEFDPQTCTTCGYVIKSALGHTHNYGTTYTTDSRGHWYACAGCSEKKNYSDHFFFNNCDDTCAICGYVREIEHDYSDRLSYDESGHWNACTVCGDILEKLPHNPGPEATENTDQICLDCGFIIQAASSHTHLPNGDLLANGDSHWYQCACGEIIDKDLHYWDEGVKDTQVGVLTYTCTVCGYTKAELLPEGPQPTDPVNPTQPGNSQTNQPETPDHSGQTGQTGTDQQPAGFAWWWYILIAVGVLILGAVIFVIIGILASRKQVGRFSSK